MMQDDAQPPKRKRGRPPGIPMQPHVKALAAERLRKLHADPEFAARHAERMRKLHADPEFALRRRALAADGVRAMFARVCDWCGARYSTRYPVVAIDGGYACKREADCGAR